MTALFTLEALQAENGDCLLLHYGPVEAPRFILIDGGPKGVFKNVLRPRLEALRALWSSSGPLPLELLLVSHIDDDHIQGIIELCQSLLPAALQGAAPPYLVKTLWHNSFSDLVGQGAERVLTRWARMRDQFEAGVGTPLAAALREAAGPLTRSVQQGRSLRQLATQLGIDFNRGFRGLVSAPAARIRPRDWGEGLQLAVLGPGRGRLEDLFRDWKKFLERKAAPLVRGADALRDLSDTTVSNLSSIIVLAEMEGRRMLLPGDARADDITAGLKAAGRMPGGRAHVDLIKLPHHGSSRNVTQDFFARVTADHYVISGNGEDGNPDKETLEMIAAARRPGICSFHFTNREGRQELGAKLKTFLDEEQARGFVHRACFRTPDALSLKIDLLAPVSY
jgi:hypothetical protein